MGASGSAMEGVAAGNERERASELEEEEHKNLECAFFYVCFFNQDSTFAFVYSCTQLLYCHYVCTIYIIYYVLYNI